MLEDRQGAVGAPSVVSAFSSQVTTRVMAIGRLNAKATPAALAAILPGEVRDTLRLYLSGRIVEWYATADSTEVVFFLDVGDVGQAHAILEQLPLGKAGMMDFELTAVGPLKPLGMLLAEPNR
jgi:hypothetical protein